MKSRVKEDAIGELVEYMAASGKIKARLAGEVVKRILKRERQGSTGIGNGVAIPHIKGYEKVKTMVGVLGRSKGGVDFDALDGGLCHLFFLLVIPKEQTAEHLAVLKRVAGIARDAELCAYLRETDDLNTLFALVDEVGGR